MFFLKRNKAKHRRSASGASLFDNKKATISAPIPVPEVDNGARQRDPLCLPELGLMSVGPSRRHSVEEGSTQNQSRSSTPFRDSMDEPSAPSKRDTFGTFSRSVISRATTPFRPFSFLEDEPSATSYILRHHLVEEEESRPSTPPPSESRSTLASRPSTPFRPFASKEHLSTPPSRSDSRRSKESRSSTPSRLSVKDKRPGRSRSSTTSRPSTSGKHLATPPYPFSRANSRPTTPFGPSASVQSIPQRSASRHTMAAVPRDAIPRISVEELRSPSRLSSASPPHSPVPGDSCALFSRSVTPPQTLARSGSARSSTSRVPSLSSSFSTQGSGFESDEDLPDFRTLLLLRQTPPGRKPVPYDYGEDPGGAGGAGAAGGAGRSMLPYLQPAAARSSLSLPDIDDHPTSPQRDAKVERRRTMIAGAPPVPARRQQWRGEYLQLVRGFGPLVVPDEERDVSRKIGNMALGEREALNVARMYMDEIHARARS